MATSTLRKQTPVTALLDPSIVWPAVGSAFVKLDPRTLIKSPVMFVLEVVTALTTVILLRDMVTGGENIGFEFQIALWLWFTVLFANFAEAVAEGRGKAQADSLRRTRTETQAKLLTGDNRNYKAVPGTSLKVAMSCWSSPATPFRPTARSSRVSPRSTKRPSPARAPP